MSFHALSIRQPWAALIMRGIKPIENRSWRVKYRGDLLIHASKTVDHRSMQWIQESLPGVWREIRDDIFDQGAILGSIRLMDCVNHHENFWFEGPWGFVLEDPIRFEHIIPYPGKLGIFRIPTEIIEESKNRKELTLSRGILNGI